MSLGKILLVSFFLVIITTIIHNISTQYILSILTKGINSKIKFWIPRGYWILAVVILLIIVSLFEAVIWALGYINLDLFETFEESFYFSLVSFTTLGTGEITLTENYRLLSVIEAANGIILFGWSTAIVIALVQRIYFNKNNEKNQKISEYDQ